MILRFEDSSSTKISTVVSLELLISFSLCISLMRLLNAFHEEPPSLVAFMAALAISFTLSLNCLPFPLSISSLTALFKLFAVTNPFDFPSTVPILKPTFISSTTIFAFRPCSAIIGHARMGTPAHIPSKTEFQPQ